MRVLLVDGNNLGFSGMANPRLSAGDSDTQATFSVIKRIRYLLEDHPDNMIIVLWDGRSWRKDIYTEYKANREQTSSQVEERSRYYDQAKDIREGLSLLGIRQMWSANMEADDMAAILAKKFSDNGDKVTLITADGDWKQLVNENVTWINIIHDKRCDYHTFEENTGFINTENFIEYKCVAGDAGDNIIGVSGIGEKTVRNIQDVFGSFRNFLTINPIEAANRYKSEKGKVIPKVLRELNYKEALKTLEHNWPLVDLFTEKRPSLTKIINEKGRLDIEGFTEFCNRLSFFSFTSRLEVFIRPFKENKYVTR